MGGAAGELLHQGVELYSATLEQGHLQRCLGQLPGQADAGGTGAHDADVSAGSQPWPMAGVNMHGSDPLLLMLVDRAV
jgi:hypothetical protein